MRARNLKPGFFKNEQLAELPYECRLLFAGLWCVADREGRLEDRPRRIKMELFPGDSCDVDDMLNQLHRHGLIVRYEEGQARYIEVSNFLKHQHPHQKEPPSLIPKPGASTGFDTGGIQQESSSSPVQEPDSPESGTGIAPTLPGARTGVARLIPSSLNPESPFLTLSESQQSAPAALDSPKGAEKPAARAIRIPDDFELTPARRQVALDEQLAPERTFAGFCDYWRSVSGTNARKLDWDATWRNWCRRQADMLPGRNNRNAAPRRVFTPDEIEQGMHRASQ